MKELQSIKLTRMVLIRSGKFDFADFDIESPILSKLKTPLDSFNRYILPIILLLIFGMFIYVFYIGMQKKDPEEL